MSVAARIFEGRKTTLHHPQGTPLYFRLRLRSDNPSIDGRNPRIRRREQRRTCLCRRYGIRSPVRLPRIRMLRRAGKSLCSRQLESLHPQDYARGGRNDSGRYSCSQYTGQSRDLCERQTLRSGFLPAERNLHGLERKLLCCGGGLCRHPQNYNRQRTRKTNKTT